MLYVAVSRYGVIRHVSRYKDECKLSNCEIIRYDEKTGKLYASRMQNVNLHELFRAAQKYVPPKFIVKNFPDTTRVF